MYQDPRRVRTRYSAVNLDDYEKVVIDALLAISGLPKGELLRRLLMKGAHEVLGASDVIDPSITKRTQ